MEILSAVDLGEHGNVKLDFKDKKILSLLGLNARTPLTKIAKDVGLSKDAVKYRIRNLEEKNVIKGSRAIIDVERLGYQSYHLFIRLRTPKKDVERTIIKKLCALSYTRTVIKFYGSYDLEVGIIARNSLELDKFVTEITALIGEHLSSHEVLEIVKTFRSSQFPRSFLEKNDNQNLPREKKNDLNLDKKDMQIIRLIKDKANISVVDIADKVKISPDSVSYRIKNLSDVILGYRAVINYHAIGYSVHALLFHINALKAEEEQTLKELFSRNNHVLWAVKTIGRFNLLAYICVKNIDELHETISAVRILFHDKITVYDSLSANAQYKYTYAPEFVFI